MPSVPFPHDDEQVVSDNASLRAPTRAGGVQPSSLRFSPSSCVMAIQSSRHRAVLEELTEWWEDLRDRGIGSRVVLVPVPRRWGRSRVLEEFRGAVEDLDGPLALSISGTALAGRAVQAQELREALTTAELGSRAARLLGLDTTAGEVQLGLGIGGLFASGLAAAVPLLLASLAVTAAGNAWDASPAGQQGAVARAARAVAAVSVPAPGAGDRG